MSSSMDSNANDGFHGGENPHVNVRRVVLRYNTSTNQIENMNGQVVSAEQVSRMFHGQNSNSDGDGNGDGNGNDNDNSQGNTGDDNGGNANSNANDNNEGGSNDNATNDPASASASSNNSTANTANNNGDGNNNSSNDNDGNSNNNNNNNNNNRRRTVRLQFGGPRGGVTTQIIDEGDGGEGSNGNSNGNGSTTTRTVNIPMGMPMGMMQNANANNGANPNPNNAHAYPGRIRLNSRVFPHLGQQFMHHHRHHAHNVSQGRANNSNNNNNNNNSNINLGNNITVAPLTEQPSNINISSQHTSHTYAELECPICYEYIQDPSHCGGCSARFCYPCLVRAMQTMAAANANNNNNNGENSNNNRQAPCCPSCRKPIPTPGDIKRDAEFYERVCKEYSTSTDRCQRVTLASGSSDNNGAKRSVSLIQCPNINCMKMIPPSELRNHDESKCEYKHMKCKYAPYGCTWCGPRKDLDAHYKIGCEMDKFSMLIGEMRKTDAKVNACLNNGMGSMGEQQQNMMLHVINHRLIQERQWTDQMMTNQLLSLQMKHAGNFFHMMEAIYVCTCTPTKFLTNAMVWKDFWFRSGVRATVNNFICLAPIGIWIMKHSLSGVQYLSKLFDPDIDLDMQVFLLDEVFLALCVLLLGVLFFSCFILDSRSSKEWTDFKLKIGPLINCSYPCIRDSVIGTTLFLHFICFELENKFDGTGGNYKGLFVTALLQLTTIFHPFVDGMLNIAAERPFAPEVGRAYGIMQLGIMYGPLVAMLGLAETFQAVWIYVTVEEMTPDWYKNNHIHRDSFAIAKIVVQNGIMISIASMYSAYSCFRDLPSEDISSLVVEKWYLVFKALLAIVTWNVVAIQMKKLAEKASKMNNEIVTRMMQNHTNQHGSLGCLFFGVWLALLCVIYCV